MKFKSLVMFLGLILCSAIYAQNVLPLIHDWGYVQKDLANSFDETSIYGCLDKSPLFKQLVASRDHQLYLEMMNQREYPFVTLAGFLCIKDAFSSETLEAGMEVFLQAKDPAMPVYGPVWQFLQDRTNATELNKAFSYIVTARGVDTQNFQLLVGLLPYDFLYNWFHDLKSPTICATFEAIILDRLYGEAREHHKPISTNMVQALNKMQALPGIPRVVFILYTDSYKGTIITNLTWALEEENVPVSSLVVLTVRKRELVQEIMANQLDLPKGRREEIEKLLHQAKPK